MQLYFMLLSVWMGVYLNATGLPFPNINLYMYSGKVNKLNVVSIPSQRLNSKQKRHLTGSFVGGISIGLQPKMHSHLTFTTIAKWGQHH